MEHVVAVTIKVTNVQRSSAWSMQYVHACGSNKCRQIRDSVNWNNTLAMCQ